MKLRNTSWGCWAHATNLISIPSDCFSVVFLYSFNTDYSNIYTYIWQLFTFLQLTNCTVGCCYKYKINLQRHVGVVSSALSTSSVELWKRDYQFHSSHAVSSDKYIKLSIAFQEIVHMISVSTNYQFKCSHFFQSLCNDIAIQDGFSGKLI